MGAVWRGIVSTRESAHGRGLQRGCAMGHNGAGVGVAFYWLESRHNRWWIIRTQMEATLAVRRREQILSSAPALWALMVLIALVVPILLGGIPT